MLGVDDRSENLGIIPCAISWLFHLIDEQKERIGARFSVRVSAVEVTGKQEMLKDLLANVSSSGERAFESCYSSMHILLIFDRFYAVMPHTLVKNKIKYWINELLEFFVKLDYLCTFCLVIDWCNKPISDSEPVPKNFLTRIEATRDLKIQL